MRSPNSMKLLGLAVYGSVAFSPVVASAWPPPPDQFIAGTTTQNCPLGGQLFPPASDPGSSAAIKSAKQSLKNQLDAALKPGAVLPLNITLNETFLSVGVFSASSEGTLFDYHYSVPGQENATAGGEVNSETIYRVGSISKLLSVYTFLAERGDVEWNQPITKFIPELSDSASDDDEEQFEKFHWEDITIGALASHLGGIPRDYSWPDFITNYTEVPAVSALLGLNGSAITPDDISPCALPVQNQTSLPLCTQFIDGLNKLGPYFPAFETPTYSNAAFRLLGHVLSNITGEPFTTTFQRNIATPLNLTSTTFTTPPSLTHALIPGDPITAQWGIDLGDENPAGSAYSTVTDLTRLGRSILRSTLLRPALTRRWLKPHARTSSDAQAVGAPWEISSFRMPLTPNATAIDGDVPTVRADLYAKSGSLGVYRSLLALDPDRGWGFVALTAGPGAADAVAFASDAVARVFAPAFEAAARAEAERAFAGTFVAADGGNGTLRLGVREGRPGVGVEAWTSGGVEVLGVLGAGASVRLYPARMGRGRWRAFRAVVETLPRGTLGGPVESACESWFSTDVAQVADRMVDDVVVEVGEDGRAVSVEVRAWRMKYVRMSDG
ncbi:putative beta-lactamase-related protein [Neofusicoccum parvum]|nr:putative beta-lactamase-related protein [Neofusicoccum parvum]